MPNRSELSQHRFGDAGRRADRRSLHPARDREALVVWWRSIGPPVACQSLGSVRWRECGRSPMLEELVSSCGQQW